MSKRLIYLFFCVLVLGLVLTGMAKAELVGWWRLDEGSGTTVYDSSGYGNDGTFNGDPEWVVGKVGGALEFDGGDYVNVPGAADINPESITLMTWVNFSTVDPADMERQDYLSRGDDYAFSLHEWNNNGMIHGIVTSAGDWAVVTGNTVVEPDTWYHTAMTYDSSTQILILYLDGQIDGELSVPAGLEHRLGGPLTIGTYSGRDLLGRLDEIKIWDEALSQAEILGAMAGKIWPYAWAPDPAHGAMLPDIWVTLSWKPGGFAASHDVYLGDNFDDVNEGAADTFRGNQTEMFFVAGFPGFPYPEGLAPGTTYYWRIDEVNELDPNSPWKGPVWSFMVPPKTAYNPNPANGAEFVDPLARLSWTGGFGAKLHYVYFGDNFDDVNDAMGAPPTGVTTYTPGPLELEKVYYWRVDEFDSVATYKGDVWSFTTTGAVGSPNPPNGAIDVKTTPILSWQPGDSAASHQVYFGTDKDAVRNATTASPEYKGSKELGSESYDPGKLAWLTTYYWRIVEVNNVNPNSPWTGSVWSFTTGDFLTIDDFESYNDLEPPDPQSNRIFLTWQDGYDTPTNGSQVGYTDPPFCEQTIVHSGRQSMPLFYDNSGPAYYSEATLPLSETRDWTEEGVGVLTLWLYGDPANAAESMYVAVSNATSPTAVVYHDNPDAALIENWTQWNIDLEEFSNQGVVLTNVDSIAIGFGNRNNPQLGGSGLMFIDDIRLYRPAPEPIEPEGN